MKKLNIIFIFLFINYCFPIRRFILILLRSTLLIIILDFTLNINNCMCQWLYQPIGASGTPYDMKFFDANTGIISYSSPALYRTTNGGQNWINIKAIRVFEMNKIDTLTCYCWARSSGNDYIFRTFNKGESWDSVAIFPYSYQGLSFVNRDTGWISGYDGSFKIWRTTNGGITIQTQTSGIGHGKIFFLNYKINEEYYGWCTDYSAVYKTTNSGQNWTFLGGPPYQVTQITMYDENIGWICASDTNAYKTTNGGFNWTAIPMPRPPNLFMNFINKIVIIDSNLLYGIGGSRYFGPGIGDGIIWKSTNGGAIWGYQQPDTAYPITKYWAMDFLDSVNGWAYGYGSQGGVNTTNGGGQILKINNANEQIIKGYTLYQNYPNPFNAISNIKYKIEKTTSVKIIVFDIMGKEITTLINKKQNIGEYYVKFDGNNLPSGVYFYSLLANGIRIDTKKLILIK